MSIPPYDRFVIESKLPVREVVERLRTYVQATQKYRFGSGQFQRASSTRKFQGILSENGFTLSRIIKYGNSFLPVIDGAFEPTSRGTTIQVRMKLHWAVVCFMAVVVAVLAVGTVRGLTELWPSPAFAIVPAFFLTMLWLMSFLGFRWEAKRARALLEKILIDS